MDLAVTRAPPRRLPALDGLRGAALLGMLAWHAQVGWVDGGFARMTIFFVLSGYLATRSWVRHPDRRFLTFWRRRTQRLAPVSLLGVAVAVAVAMTATDPGPGLRADALSVLTWTANWRFLSSGQEYGALFERESPFQHFWSLSIEEQSFVLLPLVLAGAIAVTRRRGGDPAPVVGALGIALVASPLVIRQSPDLVYFGTHIRLGEFLIGAWLALVLGARRRLDPRTTRHLRTAGRASVVVLALVMVTLERDAAWLYRGGMALFVVPVVAVVAAASTQDPVLDRTLGVGPLRALGRWALSIYVLHWPLYLLVDRWWPDVVDRRVVVPVQIAVAIGAGALVHLVVERPLLPAGTATARPRRIRLQPRLGVVGGLAVGIALVVAVVGPTTSTYDFARAEASFLAPTDDRPTSPAVRRIGVFGGSTALMNGMGLPSWADGSAGYLAVPGDARLGCGLFVDGTRVEGARPDGTPVWTAVPEACAAWAPAWTATATRNRIDVAVVFFGVWEVADWRLPGVDGPASLGDDAVDDLVVDGLRTAVEALRAGGVETVVLATSPRIGPGDDRDPVEERGLPDDVDERTARFNELVSEVAAAEDVIVFDYGDLVDSLRPDEAAQLVPDGVHPTWDASSQLWTRGLGPVLGRVLAGR